MNAANLMEKLISAREQIDDQSRQESAREDGGNQWVKGYCAGARHAYNDVIEMLAETQVIA